MVKNAKVDEEQFFAGWIAPAGKDAYTIAVPPAYAGKSCDVLVCPDGSVFISPAAGDEHRFFRVQEGYIYYGRFAAACADGYVCIRVPTHGSPIPAHAKNPRALFPRVEPCGCRVFSGRACGWDGLFIRAA